jgi:hypothetical protein
VFFAGTLSDPDLVATVFAPSNSAFESFLSSNSLTTEQLLASPALAGILEFHVVPGVAAMVGMFCLTFCLWIGTGTVAKRMCPNNWLLKLLKEPIVFIATIET